MFTKRLSLALRDIGLILSYRCRSACAHCLYNFGPDWHDWMQEVGYQTLSGGMRLSVIYAWMSDSIFRKWGFIRKSYRPSGFIKILCNRWGKEFRY